MKHLLCIILLLSLTYGSTPINAYGGVKSGQYVNEDVTTIYHQPQQQPEYVTTYGGTPTAYRFSYSSGLGSSYNTGYSAQQQQDVAQHFREESRDESGYVVGKYGYVDPYGKLRVVNYKAGPGIGYVVTGDTGPDQEVSRQQYELYRSDPSYQIQQQIWQQLARGGSSSASSAAAAARAASNSAEWTTVNGGYQSGNLVTRGGQSKFAERYVQAGGIKSPAAALRQHSTTIETVDTRKDSSSSHLSSSSASAAASASASASSSAAYTAPAAAVVTTNTAYATKSLPPPPPSPPAAPIKQYYSVKSTPVAPPPPARIVAVKKTIHYGGISQHQSPAARLVAITSDHQQRASQYSSSASSASAAASAAATSSSAYTNFGTKGGSSVRAAPLKVARYATPPGGGHSVVNFQQGGPQPFQYSYSFK